MRFFIVTVFPKRTEVLETYEPLKTIHASAWVDGTACLYRVKKDVDNSQNRRAWFGRGLQEVHYHAHNLGSTVSFEPVGTSPLKAKPIHDKQLSLW